MATGSGKMGDSIDKTRNYFRWGTLIATVFIALLLFLIPNYLHDFQQRAGVWWGLFGLVLLIIAALMAWFSDRWAEHWTYFLFWLIVLAFGIMAACGFNFDMFGIQERL